MEHTPRNYANVLADKNDSYFDPNYLLYDPKIEFDMLNEIGSGVFSNVLKVRQKGHNKLLALKKNESLDYERELAILQQLDNEYIIKLLHYRKVERELPEFYFELMETTFTEIYLSLGYADIVHYLEQILTALNYCHSKGIIHGDIKPDNMMVNRGEKKLKLIDFGSAQWYKGPNASLYFEGSRRYAAPEYFSPNLQIIGYGVDIWPVGVILLDMLHVIGKDSNNDDVLLIAKHLDFISQCCKKKEFVSLADAGNFKYVDINSEENEFLSNLAEIVEFALEQLCYKNSWLFLPLLINLLNIQIELRCTAAEAIEDVKKIQKILNL